MNEGIFPSRKVRTQEAMEEERRLAFVAATRAENRLYLTRAESRNFGGSPQYPSRFILDIDRQLIQFTKEPREGLIKEAEDYIELSRKYLPDSESDIVFPVGQRVRHAVFGTGTVTDVDRDRGAHVIQFDSMDTPRRISFRVKMERI
jgi:DNA helicase-2/ATP-dependent DNA helicase PcrA